MISTHNMITTVCCNESGKSFSFCILNEKKWEEIADIRKKSPILLLSTASLASKLEKIIITNELTHDIVFDTSHDVIINEKVMGGYRGFFYGTALNILCEVWKHNQALTECLKETVSPEIFLKHFPEDIALTGSNIISINKKVAQAA